MNAAFPFVLLFDRAARRAAALGAAAAGMLAQSAALTRSLPAPAREYVEHVRDERAVVYATLAAHFGLVAIEAREELKSLKPEAGPRRPTIH